MPHWSSLIKTWSYHHRETKACSMTTNDACYRRNRIGLPVTTLPAIKCPNPNAEHCSAAPTTIIDEPRKIVLRLPSTSPTQIVATAPQKQPTLYDATETPWSVDR